jgi:hypothetical protein
VAVERRIFSVVVARSCAGRSVSKAIIAGARHACFSRCRRKVISCIFLHRSLVYALYCRNTKTLATIRACPSLKSLRGSLSLTSRRIFFDLRSLLSRPRRCKGLLGADVNSLGSRRIAARPSVSLVAPKQLLTARASRSLQLTKRHDRHPASDHRISRMSTHLIVVRTSRPDSFCRRSA